MWVHFCAISWRCQRRIVSGVTSGQGSPSEGLAPDGQSPALSIGQSKPPTTNLFLKDSILFPQVLDDRILLAADPASQRGNEDLPGLQDGGHSLIVAR